MTLVKVLRSISRKLRKENLINTLAILLLSLWSQMLAKTSRLLPLLFSEEVWELYSRTEKILFGRLFPQLQRNSLR